MHLYSQPKKTKEGIIGYYSLATSVKDADGAYRRKVVHRLGRLTDEQAAAYRAILKTIDRSSAMDGLCSIDQIVYKDDRRYFDVLVLSALWDQ
jgi:hypothetical protein